MNIANGEHLSWVRERMNTDSLALVCLAVTPLPLACLTPHSRIVMYVLVIIVSLHCTFVTGAYGGQCALWPRDGCKRLT